MFGQGRERMDETDAVGAHLSQADDAARTDVDARCAHLLQRIEPVLKRPRRYDVGVMLRAGVDIMVIIVEPRSAQHLRLLLAKHPQRHAGFHAHLPHTLDHLDDARHVRSEEHTSELQSLMRTSYAFFCLKNKK